MDFAHKLCLFSAIIHAVGMGMSVFKEKPLELFINSIFTLVFLYGAFL